MKKIIAGFSGCFLGSVNLAMAKGGGFASLMNERLEMAFRAGFILGFFAGIIIIGLTLFGYSYYKKPKK